MGARKGFEAIPSGLKGTGKTKARVIGAGTPRRAF
jgi:hypothetical protein